MIKNALLSIAFIAGISGFVISMYNHDTKLVYIEMGKVYNEFSLSKELNKGLEDVFKKRKLVIDSLYEDLRKQTQELKFLEKKTINDVKRVAKLEEEYYYKQQEFEKQNQTTSAECDAKIWNQINQYIKDYGKSHDYTFMLGANGNGNVMYASESKNVTQDVIQYINNRYNGTINP